MVVHATLSHRDWIKGYLTVWQGMLGLTEKELELSVLICERYLELEKDITNPHHIWELLLSSGTRASMKEQLSMSANHFQNTLASLRRKGVLLHKDSKDQLHPRLIPQKSITFNFTTHE